MTPGVGWREKGSLRSCNAGTHLRSVGLKNQQCGCSLQLWVTRHQSPDRAYTKQHVQVAHVHKHGCSRTMRLLPLFCKCPCRDPQTMNPG